MRFSKRDFIVQQGLLDPHPGSAEPLYSALQFQPRVIGLIALVGTVSRNTEIFLTMGVVLWWSVAVPRWNPFDRLYNSLFAMSAGLSLLPAAPPRLFAQALAGSLSLSIAALMATGNPEGALILQSAFIVAVAAVVFGGFCAGAFLYHALNRHWVCRTSS